MNDNIITDEMIVKDSEMLTRVWIKRFNFPREFFEELNQEIALALTEARKRFNPEAASWATYSAIRSKGAALDFFRRQVPYSQRNLLLLDKPQNMSEGQEGNESSIDYYGSTRDDQTQVEVIELLNNISERYRKIILWMVFGYSQREIAEKLGLSERRVWMLTETIRRNLADAS